MRTRIPYLSQYQPPFLSTLNALLVQRISLFGSSPSFVPCYILPYFIFGGAATWRLFFRVSVPPLGTTTYFLKVLHPLFPRPRSCIETHSSLIAVVPPVFIRPQPCSHPPLSPPFSHLSAQPCAYSHPPAAIAPKRHLSLKVDPNAVKGVVAAGASNLTGSHYKLSFAANSSRLAAITNLQTGVSAAIEQEYYEYVSAFQSEQNSGAYVFRPEQGSRVSFGQDQDGSNPLKTAYWNFIDPYSAGSKLLAFSSSVGDAQYLDTFSSSVAGISKYFCASPNLGTSFSFFQGTSFLSSSSKCFVCTTSNVFHLHPLLFDTLSKIFCACPIL